MWTSRSEHSGEVIRAGFWLKGGSAGANAKEEPDLLGGAREGSDCFLHDKKYGGWRSFVRVAKGIPGESL